MHSGQSVRTNTGEVKNTAQSDQLNLHEIELNLHEEMKLFSNRLEKENLLE